MRNLRAAQLGDFFWSGTDQVSIDGYGDATITLTSADGSPRKLTIYDVALSTSLTTNLVSFSKLRKRGLWWDTRPGNNCLRRSDGTFLGAIQEREGQQVLEWKEGQPVKLNPQQALADRSAAMITDKPQRKCRHTSWTHRKPLLGDTLTWHRRLGHPGPDALRCLTTASRGVRLKMEEPEGPHRITTVDCDACGIAKARRVVRRAPREATARASPGDRIALDFHPMTQGYAGYTSVWIFTDRTTGYSWDYYATSRSTPALCAAITRFLIMLEVQYSIKVKVIECDNEITETHPRVAELLTDRGILAEPSAPNTQAQNGGAERVAAVIIQKSRAMRAGAKLPEYLWPESIKAATYLYNRTPSLHRNRKTPYELFHSQMRSEETAKPDLSHLRAYGCKVFALTADAQLRRNRLRRQAPRAWIGFLVGYTSSNSFRVWNPLQQEVFTTRDVTFNERQLFDGRSESLRDDLLKEDLEAIQARIQQLLSIQEHTEQWTSQPPEDEADEIPDEESDENEPAERSPSAREQEAPEEYTTAKFEVLPTPPQSPPAAFFHTLAAGLGVKGREVGMADDEITRRMVGKQPTRHRTSFKAAFLAGRLQSPKHRTSNRRAVHGSLASSVGSLDGGSETCLSDKLDVGKREAQRERALRDRMSSTSGEEKQPVVGTQWGLLEPLPSSHAKISSHPYQDAILIAEKVHLQSHAESKSWIEVAKSTASGRRVLGCHWVYVYKLDKHGRFLKIKARLVVRGDQQAIDSRETYAATLAGMSFRTLVALTNRFDYDMLQYDAVNAFVHAKLDEEIYMEMPRGYQKPGTILKLQKALYGLRRSPLLWQKHFEKGLQSAGFRRVPGEDCCWLHGDIIFFFYVDDCVLCFPKQVKAKAIALIEDLQKTYHLEGGKPLQWFLGIEVIRDRENRRLWLSQSAYIDKMRRLLGDYSPRIRSMIPMIQEELMPYEEIASPGSVNLYQRKVGTIMYAAVMTRPDVAFAASRLARFNQNPGPQHHQAADRALWYLIETRGLCLEYGTIPGCEEDGLQVASDASFADNSTDRRSSQAFVMKLFGGITSWRANKQDTVTTSTTEAELLALSQAAKEALFASRLISSLHVDLSSQTARRAAAPPSRVTIECDNKQTIRLVTAELVQLRTKLRHVDVHNHWLRQEVLEERIEVIYTPSTRLLADGLTKSLPREAFAKFTQQLKLADLSKILEQRRNDEGPSLTTMPSS